MKVIHEYIQYDNPKFPLRSFINQRPNHYKNPWHYHEQIEFIYILSGKMDYYVENQKFELNAGDIVLAGTKQPHRFISHGVRYFVLQFNGDPFFDASTHPYNALFTGIHFSLSKLNYIFSENKHVKETIKSAIGHIHDEYVSKELGFELFISMKIREIFGTLIRYDNKKVLLSNNNEEIAKLKPVLDYVEANLNLEINMKEASELVNFSYSYFSRYFKKVIGMTFTEYVNYHRIKMAERILLTEDISVELVAQTVGFENIGHFYNIFRSIHQCSPKQFRDLHVETS